MIANRRDLGGLPAAGGKTVRPGLLVRSAHLAQAEESELEGIGINSDDRDLFETIMHLPSKYKIILDLYYIEGYKSGEIANILNLSPVAVRKRLQYARQLLKNELERNG